jgi:hypothetical protein
MSGTINLCGQQQFDNDGNLLQGGLVYMLQAGTLVPQAGYRDAALVNAWPNPIQLDASGRVPSIFFADGTIRIRLTDASGVVLFDFDNLPVLGSSSAGAIIDTTDPNARFNTGDMKVRYGTGALAGFVRCNGLTVGPPSSGGTERANADCQALFNYLWNLNDDVTCPVVPSRGASAAVDWAATSPYKQVTLPDFAGCFLGGIDDMGAGPRGRLTSHNFGIAGTDGKPATALGARAGFDWWQIGSNELPTHAHGYNEGASGNGHLHGENSVNYTGTFGTFVTGVSGPGVSSVSTGSAIDAITAGTDNTNYATTGIAISNAGSGNAKYAIPPVRLITFYMKL